MKISIPHLDYFIDIEPLDLGRISSSYSQLLKQDFDLYPPAFNVKEVTLYNINSLKSLPYRSRFQFLAYFAILESLLTHKPELKDSFDSITRQIIYKLVLLNNIWDLKLDYTPFGEAKTDVIWKKMYNLRSTIAHGDHIDPKKFGCLKDYNFAFSLLEQSVKSILRYTLINPRLIVDLRDC